MRWDEGELARMDCLRSISLGYGAAGEYWQTRTAEPVQAPVPLREEDLGAETATYSLDEIVAYGQSGLGPGRGRIGG